MSKGDQVLVLLRVGDKVERYTIEARTNGASVVVTDQRGQPFIEVMELSKNNKPIRTLKANREAVIAIEEAVK